MSDKIKFEFTVEETNAILAALGEAPAKVAMGPIQAIISQGGPQAAAIEAAKAEAEQSAPAAE